MTSDVFRDKETEAQSGWGEFLVQGALMISYSPLPMLEGHVMGLGSGPGTWDYVEEIDVFCHSFWWSKAAWQSPVCRTPMGLLNDAFKNPTFPPTHLFHFLSFPTPSSGWLSNSVRTVKGRFGSLLSQVPLGNGSSHWEPKQRLQRKEADLTD